MGEPGLSAVLQTTEPARQRAKDEKTRRRERGGSSREDALPQLGEGQFLNTFSKSPLIFVFQP